jgi:hypothetical protein
LRDPDADPKTALRVVGRLIRSGDLSRPSRDALEQWWQSLSRDSRRSAAAVAALEASLSSLPPLPPPSTHGRSLTVAARTLAAARDDAESALVALGRAALAGVPGAAEAERRAAEALRALDEGVEAREEELTDAYCEGGDAEAGDADEPWLSRISRLDDSPWWCRLRIAGDLRRRRFTLR